MITHRVIIKKPHVSYQSWSNYHEEKIKSQEDLDKYIAELNKTYNIGDLITLSSAKQAIHTLAQVSVIAAINNKFDTLERHHRISENPSILKIVQAFPGANTEPWTRQDNIMGYRHVTEHELANLTNMSRDQIQNHCNEIVARTNPTATRDAF